MEVTRLLQSSALSEDKATIRVHVLLRSNLYDGYVYVFCALVLCVRAVSSLTAFHTAAGGANAPAYWAPASLIRPTPKKTPVA